jgi:hypothetical protein
VTINPDIITEDYTTNSIITKNDKGFYTIYPPTGVNITNSNPTYNLLSGVSNFVINIFDFVNSNYILYIGTSTNDNLTAIGELKNIISFKGTEVAFKGSIQYELTNYNYGSDSYIYSYLETIDGLLNVTSKISNKLHIPHNKIENALKVEYSNFWPYTTYLDDTYSAIDYVPVSGGPLEVFTNDTVDSTRKGYVLCRNNTPNITDINNNEIPEIFDDGGYIVIKGYITSTSEIISLSNVDVFNNVKSELPSPLKFTTQISVGDTFHMYNIVNNNNIDYKTILGDAPSHLMGEELCQIWNSATWPNVDCSKSENDKLYSKNCNSLFQCQDGNLVNIKDRPPAGKQLLYPKASLPYSTDLEAYKAEKNSVVGQCYDYGLDYGAAANPLAHCWGETKTGNFMVKGIPQTILASNTILSYNTAVESFDTEFITNNYLWSIKGTKDNYNFNQASGNNLNICIDKYASTDVTNKLTFIIQKGDSAIDIGGLNYGEYFSIKSGGNYLTTSINDTGPGTCGKFDNTNTYPVIYDTTSSNWYLKKIDSSVYLNLYSWGYEKIGTESNVTSTGNIIYQQNPIKINMGVRDNHVNSLVPNFKADDGRHVGSTFSNNMYKPLSTYKAIDDIGIVYMNTISALKLDTNTAQLAYSISLEKMYMMGIKDTISIMSTKSGSGSTKAFGMDNLLSYNNAYSIHNQVYSIKAFEIDYILTIHDIQNASYYDDITKGNIIYIKQQNEPYIENTLAQSDTIKSLTAIKPIKQKLSYSRAGSGGQYSIMYLNNNISDIKNVVCVAGGGGGSGIYSADNFNATKSMYNGNDGVDLSLTGKDNIVELTEDMNNMNGGRSGVFSGNDLYEIPSGSLGGAVHTFKNHRPYHSYSSPDGGGSGANYGFYPNFKDKHQTGDEYIYRPQINGKPFYTIKGNKIQYKGDVYDVDSYGLEKSGNFGNGGSSYYKGDYISGANINNWGNKGNKIIYGNSRKILPEEYTKTYSIGGGGGGGFGGGSAGIYLFNQKNAAHTQSLSNVPPGGGGGGNSFYNNSDFKGTAYGINSKHVKGNKVVPSILPQMLKLVSPNKVKNYNTDEYLKGTNKMYTYIYTGKK